MRDTAGTMDDYEFQEHVRTWRGFTRLMAGMATLVAAVLVAMAIALL